MSTEPDPLKKDLERLRRMKGLCPLTPEEADAALAATPDTPLPEDEIERLLLSAASGGACLEEPVPEQEWDPDRELEEIDEEVLQLNRNAGDEDAEVDQRVDEHFRKAVGDDGEEDDERGDGQAPPGAGG